MNSAKSIFIITGDIGEGKTTFLNNLSVILRKRWSVDGFVLLGEGRGHDKETPCAYTYKLKFIKHSRIYPWAKKKDGERGFDFSEETKQLVENETARWREQESEIILMDDLGALELSGEGFHDAFKMVLDSDVKAIVVCVKKRVLDQFIEYFKIDRPIVVDLETLDGRAAKNSVVRKIKALDGEKIGIYSTVNGVVEVGVGSALHATGLPMKGNFLALVQNFFLVLYGKDLKGRGLIWIAGITGGLKSFSPAGSKLKPMFYIFAQGALFSLPSLIGGWNFVTALLGSFLMGLSTILLNIMFKYLMFGIPAIVAYINATNKLLAKLDISAFDFWHLFLGLLLFKGTLAMLVGIVAYSINFSKFMNKLVIKVEKIEKRDLEEIKVQSVKSSLIGAVRDITLVRFLFPFAVTILMIYFFANLSGVGFVSVVIRAFVMAWFGFFIARRINFYKIVKFLRSKNLDYVADGLEKSLMTVSAFRAKDKKKETQDGKKTSK
jgi:nucleoside-triphosphatase THEP1